MSTHLTRRRGIAAGALLGLVAAPLSVVAIASPAFAAPVTINLLNINDFHGRIDENTTAFATTIEQLRADEGEASSLFLSAGDSIGASLFASSSAQDEPTLDVLNALDLAATAVGNHEFDQGFDDLDGRVSDLADFPLLGANVYTEGTSDPVLQEFETFEVSGVTVGVIGVVTQGTPSAVSPDGIAGLEFGDPVEAVNRVAIELSDGDAGNGEADVIVAEYHEGGPEAATLAEATAANPLFDSIVNETSTEVDVIFNGHTHNAYAYEAPVPGEPTATRPVLQTGKYGENVGQVVLTVESTTGEVTAHTERIVPRVEAEDLSFPRVQEVKTITDAALAQAAELGDTPVGEITDDITTAFAGGEYGPEGYAGGERDDRRAESSLGGLVANALRDGISGEATPDLGITNPGGLRDELLFDGETASNPANTDGVVTFAEANEVLPFGNTAVLVDLTGAQLAQVLEEQWQTDADGGPIPDGDEGYLQLGLSDNVRVTADPANPAGSRITSVYIDDAPLDPAATYTVSTLSFLAQGGDNFRTFAEGEALDTGLLDAQLFRDYLADNSPLSPDFARQQVFTDGLPATLPAGQRVQFDLGRPTGTGLEPISGTTLDLTSLGSPANESVTATLVDGGSETDLGDFAVSDGVARITLNVPAGSEGAEVDLVAAPSGTTVTIPVSRGSSQKVSPRMQVTAPKQVRRGKRARVTVALSAKGAEEVTGQVRFRYAGNKVVKDVTNGTVKLRLKKLTRKKTILKVIYLGDESFQRVKKTATIRARSK